MRSKARNGEPMAWVREAANYASDLCLLWPYGQSNGYGLIHIDGKPIHAHRAVCLIAHGEPKQGQTDAAHSCGNKLCCNPRHLRHATPLENAADKKGQGRELYGSKNPNSKLADSDVRDIRSMCLSGEMSQRSIAKKYGVSQMTVSAISRNTRWSWLT